MEEQERIEKLKRELEDERSKNIELTDLSFHLMEEKSKIVSELEEKLQRFEKKHEKFKIKLLQEKQEKIKSLRKLFAFQKEHFIEKKKMITTIDSLKKQLSKKTVENSEGDESINKFINTSNERRKENDDTNSSREVSNKRKVIISRKERKNSGNEMIEKKTEGMNNEMGKLYGQRKGDVYSEKIEGMEFLKKKIQRTAKFRLKEKYKELEKLFQIKEENLKKEIDIIKNDGLEKIKTLTEKNDELRRKIEEFSKKKEEELKEEEKKREDENYNIEEILNLKTKLEEAKKERKESQDKVKELQEIVSKNNEDYNLKILELRKQLKEVIEDKNQEIVKMKETMEKKENNILELTKNNNELSEKNHLLENSNSELIEQNKKLNKKIEKLKKRNKKTKRKHKKINDKVEEFNDVKLELEKNFERIKLLEEENKYLKEDKLNLEKKLEFFNSQSTLDKKKIEELDNKIQKIQRKRIDRIKNSSFSNGNYETENEKELQAQVVESFDLLEENERIWIIKMKRMREKNELLRKRNTEIEENMNNLMKEYFEKKEKEVENLTIDNILHLNLASEYVDSDEVSEGEDM